MKTLDEKAAEYAAIFIYNGSGTADLLLFEFIYRTYNLTCYIL